MKYKARSCKATLLSWLATSEICSYEERRLLGHHLDPKMVSMATYSRHVYAPIAVKVARFLGSIKRGDHDPQMPLAERVRISLAPACENQQEEDYALEEDVDAESQEEDMAELEICLEPSDRAGFPATPAAGSRRIVNGFGFVAGSPGTPISRIITQGARRARCRFALHAGHLQSLGSTCLSRQLVILAKMASATGQSNHRKHLGVFGSAEEVLLNAGLHMLESAACHPGEDGLGNRAVEPM